MKKLNKPVHNSVYYSVWNSVYYSNDSIYWSVRASIKRGYNK